MSNRLRYARLPKNEAEAVALQAELAGCVVVADNGHEFETVAGLDIAYDKDSDEAIATAVVMRRRDFEVLERSVARGRSEFPYVPGLLAFRELPLLLEAIGGLKILPDVFVCDGYGLTHPRRFGLACHLGVVLDMPAIGVAKNPPHLPVTEPRSSRGEWTAIKAGEEVVGCALRTRDDVKPIYVSVGHRCTLDTARNLMLDMAPEFRLPEPIRAADRLGRELLAESRK
ncbi:endonuclease V [Glycomyces buryatensis]|uniref:Endonuclease V n=2 Tax=Glycomyces buryatensis TaxID=2570927 RepID=A0A4V4HT02_9ACTN|nr:endonuclease V [Glycomyces buryatensis]